MTQTQTTTIKTIDINGKEWFDKVNGNSYFSAQVTLNFGMDDSRTIYVPYQYGYGTAFEYESIRQLQMDGILPDDVKIYSPSQYCRDNGIILRTQKTTNCRKSEIKQWGSN